MLELEVLKILREAVARPAQELSHKLPALCRACTFARKDTESALLEYGQRLMIKSLPSGISTETAMVKRKKSRDENRLQTITVERACPAYARRSAYEEVAFDSVSSLRATFDAMEDNIDDIQLAPLTEFKSSASRRTATYDYDIDELVQSFIPSSLR